MRSGIGESERTTVPVAYKGPRRNQRCPFSAVDADTWGCLDTRGGRTQAQFIPGEGMMVGVHSVC